jgi:hypothetical protein
MPPTVTPTNWNEELRPPFEGALGAWVDRQHFTGTKSFAFFQCTPCGTDWFSAHGRPAFKQACKTCGGFTLARALWRNAQKKAKDALEREREEKGDPHRRDLCEACKKSANGCCF